MDEKYIQDLYNGLGGSEVFGSYDKYKKIISTDSSYVKDIHDYFGEETLGSFENFSKLVMGKNEAVATEDAPVTAEEEAVDTDLASENGLSELQEPKSKVYLPEIDVFEQDDVDVLQMRQPVFTAESTQPLGVISGEQAIGEIKYQEEVSDAADEIMSGIQDMDVNSLEQENIKNKKAIDYWNYLKSGAAVSSSEKQIASKASKKAKKEILKNNILISNKLIEDGDVKSALLNFESITDDFSALTGRERDTYKALYYNVENALLKKVDEDISKRNLADYTEIDFNGIPRADIEKVNEVAKDIAKQFMPGGIEVEKSNAYRTIYEKLKSKVEELRYVKPTKDAAEKDPRYEPLINKIGEDKWDNFVKTSSEARELISQADSIQSNISNELNQKLESYYKKNVILSTNDYKDKLKQDVSDGVISVEEANEKLNSYQTQQINKYNLVEEDYNEKAKELLQERTALINKDINALYKSFQEEYNIPYQDLDELNKIYSDAYKETIKKEGDFLKSQEDFGKMLFGRNYMVLSNFGKSFNESFSRSISSAGILLNQPSLVTLGDEMATSFSIAPDKLENFSDLLDLSKVSKATGRLAGSAATSIAVTSLVGAATGGLGVIPALAITAAAGMMTETMDMAGVMYRDVLAQTGSIDKANKARDEIINAQMGNWYLYTFDGLPFVGKALRGIKTLGGRIITAGGVEVLTETGQETVQTAQEETITERAVSGEEISVSGWSEKLSPKLIKETFLEVAPGSFLTGSAGRISTEVIESAKKSKFVSDLMLKYATSQVQEADEFLKQKIVNSISKFGKNFTTSWLTTLKKTGNFGDEKSFSDAIRYVNTADGLISSNTYKKLDDKNQRLYAYFLNQYETKKQEAELTKDPISQREAKEAKIQLDNFISFVKPPSFLERGMKRIKPKTADFSYVELQIGKNEPLIMSGEQLLEFVDKNPNLFRADLELDFKVTINNNPELTEQFNERFNAINDLVKEPSKKSREKTETEEEAGVPPTPKKPVSVETATAEEVEAQKADIERRRKEELENEQKFVSSKKRQEREGGQYKVISTEDIDLEASNLDNIPSDAKVIVLEERGLNTEGQKVGTVRIITKYGAETFDVFFNTDKINDKYDAELAALEQPKAEEPASVEAAPVEELTSQEVEKVAKIAGVKAKNIRGLYDVNRKMFGQNRIKSLASAVVMDRAIGQMAKRAGVPKSEMYSKIQFKKGDDGISELESNVEILYQGKKKTYTLYHSTTSPLSGDFRIKGKNNSYGVYFSPNKKYSKVFGDRTYKVKAKPKNTLILNDSEVKGKKIFNIDKDSFDEYRKKGYDSIAWFRNGKLVEFIALDPSIVKEREISFQKAPSGALKQEAPIFKSTAQEGISKIQQKAATPEQWVKMINDKGGKGTSQELEWIGLSDYLNEWKKENNAKSVPKEVVEQYINDNQIEVVEVSKGEGKSFRYNSVDDYLSEIERAERRGDYDLSEELTSEMEDFDLGGDTRGVGRETKHSRYTLEGGENYREVLLTLPSNKKSDQKFYKKQHFDEGNILAHLRINERTLPNGERVMFIEEVQSDWAQEGKKKGFASPENKDKIKELQAKKQDVLNSSESYRILNEKTDGNLDIKVFNAIQQTATSNIDNPYFTPESRKNRFLKEINETMQYWRRNDEYKTPNISNEEWALFYDTYINELEGNSVAKRGYEKWYVLASLENEISIINEEIQNNEAKEGIPQMPYKKTDQWVGMAMRRAMQMAAQEGFDRIAWVTGEQSADRYNLSKQVDAIKYTKEGGKYNIIAENNGVDQIAKNNLSESELESAVGKEVAQKIVNGEGDSELNFGFKTLTGQDLKVGGEGMKAFYNSILPKVAKKEAQRFDKDAKVEVVQVSTTSDLDRNNAKMKLETKKDVVSYFEQKIKESKDDSNTEVLKELLSVAKENLKRQQAVVDGQFYGTNQLSIPITPEMRMNLNSAVPLFQGEQGAMLAEDGNYIIYALTNPNVSTPLHELSHVYEHYLTDAERKSIEEWSGHKSGTVEFSEKFARGFEKYLADGKAPNSKLQKIFDKFKEWLTDIYNGIIGSEIDIELNDKMRSIYDQMLSEEQPKSATRKKDTKPKKKKVVVDEMSALKTQLRLEAKAARDANTNINKKRKQLASLVKDFKKRGKITANQARTIINKISSVNVYNSKSIESFIDYIEKIYNNADYADKFVQSMSLRSKIKKSLKNKKTDAKLIEMAKMFESIDPKFIENIDEYIENANSVLQGIRTSKVVGTDIKWRMAPNLAKANKYIESKLKEQREKILEIKRQEFESILGVSASDLSYDEMMLILSTDEEVDNKKETLIRKAIDKAFNTYKLLINSIISNGVDPFTGETVSSPNKKIIKEFMEINLSDLTVREAIESVDALNNYIINGTTSGMGRVVAIYRGAKNTKQLVDKGLISKALRLFGSKNIARISGFQITSMPILFERLFKGQAAGREVSEAIGFDGVVNGVAKARKIASKAVDSYVNNFKNKKPNGKKFNDSYNITERGLIGFMRRTIVGEESEQLKEFKRRKELIRQTIDKLKNGTDKEKIISEEYQIVFDNTLKNSDSIEDLDKAVDKTNLEAVKFWNEQYKGIYDKLSDVSLNIYNDVLGSDINYIPDSFRSTDLVQDKEFNWDDSSLSSVGNSLYQKKSGTLEKSTRPTTLPKNKYINLDFDTNMANIFEAAMIDVETAESIQQVKGAIESKYFSKLIESKEDRDLLESRIKSYIKRVRGKDIVDRITSKDLNEAVNFIGKLGVARALGGITQILKQTIPVAINTLINTGGILDLRTIGNADINKFIDKSGYAIANRGISSQSTIESVNKSLKEAKKSTLGKLGRFVENASDFWLETFLVNPDVAIARASWISYYQKYLKNQKIDTKNIDWNTHKLNKEAANYAQKQVDRQQNVSDSDLQGEFLTNKNPEYAITRKVLIPFMNFVLNQKARMYSDAIVLTSKTSSSQDKVAASISLAGLAAEMAAFYTISLGIRLLIFEIAKSFMGYDEPEDEEEKRLKNQARGIATNFTQDVLVPFPKTEVPIVGAVNYGLNLLQSDTEEKERFLLFNDEEQDYIQSLGTYGITASKVIDTKELMTMAFSDTYTNKYGTKKKLPEDVKNILKIATPMSIGYNVGLLPSEFGSLTSYMKKIAEKQSFPANQSPPEETKERSTRRDTERSSRIDTERSSRRDTERSSRRGN